MNVNKNDFKYGDELYIYFYGHVRDRSGNCSLGITYNKDHLFKYVNSPIYKIKLEQLEVIKEEVKVEETKTIYKLK